MNIEDARAFCDNLDKPDKKSRRFGKTFYIFVGSFTVTFLLFSILLLPLFQGKNGLEIISDMMQDVDNQIVGDEPISLQNFWVYPVKPKNTIFQPPIIDYDKFWNTFEDFNIYELQFFNGEKWVDAKESLEVIRSYPEFNRQKLNFSFTPSVSGDYRIVLVNGFDVKSYSSKNSCYDLNYNYFNEDFNISFDWTDMLGYDNLEFNPSVSSVSNKQSFGFNVVIRNVKSGEKISLDPEYTVFTGTTIYTYLSNGRQLCRQSNGTLWCTFEENKDVHLAFSEDLGETWTDYEIYGYRDSRYPALCVDSKDVVHIVWAGYSNADTNDYQIRYTNTTDLSVIVDIVNEDLMHFFPSIAVDSLDNIHVPYELDDTDSEVGYVRSMNNGGSWSSPVLLTNEIQADDDVFAPTVEVDVEDNIHIAFSCEDYLGVILSYSILHIQSSDYGATFTSWESDLVLSYGGRRWYPVTLAIDDNNFMHLTADQSYGTANDNIYWIHNVSNGWIPTTGYGENIEIDAEYPSICCDSNEHTYILFDDYNYIAVLSNDTTGWTDVGAITDNTADTYPSSIYAQWPVIDGYKTNQPKTGYAFIFSRGTTSVCYQASDDLSWDMPNSAPTFSNEAPTNQTTDVSVNPWCYVVCNDIDDIDTLRVDFYENSTGDYIWVDGNDSISPGDNVSFYFDNASSDNTQYWWRVFCNDGTVNVSDTYTFTTEAGTPRVWTNVEQWNFSFSNTSKSWYNVNQWNFSFSNSTRIQTNIDQWNFSFSNSSIRTWTNINQWNFSFSNTSKIYYNVNQFNFSFSNSTRSWYNINQWNFSFSNTSETFLNIGQFNFSFSNGTRVWTNTEQWNFSFSNSSSRVWTNINQWNFSFSNGTRTQTNTGQFNFSFSNTSETFLNTGQFNFSFSNGTRVWTNTEQWNFSFSNSSSRVWTNINQWNFSFSNGTRTQTNTGQFNFSFSNTSETFLNTGQFNFSFSNSTRSWYNVNQWNFSFSNSSKVQTNIGQFNFSFSNGTQVWTNTEQWNFSFSNSSSRVWTNINQWNFSFSNGTRTQTNTGQFNFSFSNSTKTFYNINQWNFSFSNSSKVYYNINQWNFSFSNTSVLANLTITNEHPANESSIPYIYPTLYFTINSSTGLNMNYTIYWDYNLSLEENLSSANSITNGTIYQLFINASTNGTTYYWSVNLTDTDDNWINKTYHFTTRNETGNIMLGSKLFPAVLLFALIPFVLFFIMYKRKKKYRRY